MSFSRQPPRRWVSALACVLVLLAEASPQAHATETITVDAGLVDGIVPAIHGVTNGPVISNLPDEEPLCRNFSPADHSAAFVAAAIPQTRTHGGGELDMHQIWRPFPNYAGQDPTKEANYDWTRANQALEQIVAVGSIPYLRIGNSKNDRDGSVCDPSLVTNAPPDDPDIFGQVTLHILKHFLDGWDNGFYYDIPYLEIWNEFYIDEFWSGTGTEAAILYEAVRNATKPEFPNVMLGPSINTPWTSNPVPSEFWTYIINNNVPVDFVSPHFYGPRPAKLASRIYHAIPSADDKSWENLFAIAGLPTDTPIVIAEWNRGSGCYNGGTGGTIPGGAFVAATLMTMAELHPANSGHNVIMSHLFSTRFQIWKDDLTPRGPGVGLESYARLVNETPHKLALTGTYADTTSIDFHAIAGKSDDDSKLNLLVSYYDTSDTDCPDNTNLGTIVPLNVNINNLPWGNAEFTWERWMHTSNSALALVDSGTSSGGSFSTSQDMHANVLELYLLAEHSCGNGMIGPGEICDDGSANGGYASCCTKECTFKTDGPASCDANLCTTTDTCTAGVCTPGGCREGEACSVCGGACSSAASGCACVY
ncbi:MAG: hypothetical protein VCC00_07310 [Deltaproteobacteria bacterium]